MVQVIKPVVRPIKTLAGYASFAVVLGQVALYAVPELYLPFCGGM